MPANRATAAAPDPDEPDFDAIHAAVVATVQGRWFLDQYASRIRDADMAQVLAAIGRLETEVARGRGGPAIATPAVAAPAPDPLPPGPDIARLCRDLGELADALMRARADIAAIEPPGGAIAGVLGDLEDRLHAIAAALSDSLRGDDPFGDLRAFAAANANSPATPNPVETEGGIVDAGIEAPDLPAEVEPPAAEHDRCVEDRPAAADPIGVRTPRLSHLLMAAEFDRLRDAQAAAGTRASDQPVSQLAVTAPVEATIPVEVTAPDELPPPQAACAVTTAADHPSLVPDTPAPPPRRGAADIAVDLFADVMALTEAERIALFT
jgi:hypothetical protein